MPSVTAMLVITFTKESLLKWKDQYSCAPFTNQGECKYIIFMQLGFSSNVTSETVTSTNFVKNFNFCGRLYFDSLVAKPLSNLYCDISSNFQSND